MRTFRAVPGHPRLATFPRTRAVRGVGVAAIALSFASIAASCSSGTGSTPVTVPPNGVLVAHYAFTPSTLTVRSGTTVTWVFNDPNAPHNVVSRSSALRFSSGSPLPRGTWSFTFTRPGTYAYRCDVHTWMRGTIVVTP